MADDDTTDDDTTDETWWEPPLAGSEVEQVLGALDRLRATFRWKAGGLDAPGLQCPPVGIHALLGLFAHDTVLVEGVGVHHVQ